MPHGSKAALSHVIWDRVVELLGERRLTRRTLAPRRGSGLWYALNPGDLKPRGTTLWLDAFSPPSP